MSNQINLADARWIEVRLIDLFDMQTGRYYPTKSFSSGKTPLITAKSINNGINHFTDTEPRFPAGCLTIGKVGMDVFYQYCPFIASSDVTILIPKFSEYNSYIGRFIAVSARQQSSVFGYGNQIRLNDSMKIKILLPADNSNSPDWRLIERYMRQVETKLLRKATVHFENKVALIERERERERLAPRWSEVRLEDVFDVIQRGKRLTKNNQVSGNTPYVSSTATTNGVDNFIGNLTSVRQFKDGITIANSGSVGAAFHHPYSFIASDHVTILRNSKATPYSYLFLATALSKLGEKYAFNREMSDSRIRREKIILPVDMNNQINWDYMDSHMKTLEIKSVYRWLKHLHGTIDGLNELG